MESECWHQIYSNVFIKGMWVPRWLIQHPRKARQFQSLLQTSRVVSYVRFLSYPSFSFPEWENKRSTCLWFKATAISSSLWFPKHTRFWFHRNLAGGNLASTSLLCFPFVISVCLRAMEEEISTVYVLVPIQEGPPFFCPVQTASYCKQKLLGVYFLSIGRQELVKILLKKSQGGSLP